MTSIISAHWGDQIERRGSCDASPTPQQCFSSQTPSSTYRHVCHTLANPPTHTLGLSTQGWKKEGFGSFIGTPGLVWQLCVLVILLLLLCEHVDCWWTTKRGDIPVSLNSLSVSNIVPFVRNHYEFLNFGFQSTGETLFWFQPLNVRHVRSPSLMSFLHINLNRNKWCPFLVDLRSTSVTWPDVERHTSTRPRA